MRRLQGKLHSENGASILMAMLLLLVCCMVAASILAAVMSNAGKSRSNRAEQQKYLTLSSAIQLVADEIEKAEYTWKYTVYEWDVTTESDTEDSDMKESVTEYFFYCEQTRTVCKSDDDLHAQIPLEKWLDWELGKQFVDAGAGYGTSVPLGDLFASNDPFVLGVDEHNDTATARSLLITLPDDLAGYPYENSGDPMEVYQVPKEVTVRVELNHKTHHIRLTAWLGEGAEPPTDKSDTMIAELVASRDGDVPLLGYSNPAGRTAGDLASVPDDASLTPVQKTMKWKLNWIKKGGL